MPNGGIDTAFLKKFNVFIRKKVAEGKRFFIVVGGGKIARHYRDAAVTVAGKITKTDLDWLGVHTTRLNAHLLRTIFQDIAYPRIIENYDHKIEDLTKPVVVAAGWKPGWSTDYDAVILAQDYGASTILNLSNIDYVYDKDPAKFKNARRIERTTWEHFEKLVGNEWHPGTNAPFDPIATRQAKKLGLTVIILRGDDFENLNNAISGKKFKGTVVMPFKMDASFYNREYFEEGIGYSGYTTNIGQMIRFNLVNFYRALTIKLFLRPKKLLDVGCATGLMVKYLRMLGVEAWGLEISKYALSRAEKDIRQYLKVGDILDIPFANNSFDTVVSFDVLDHIPAEDMPQALAQCNSVAQTHILHKVFTTENGWIRHFYGKDISHVSVYSKHWWHDRFAELGYGERSGFFPNLPQFMESIFLLRKKEQRTNEQTKKS